MTISHCFCLPRYRVSECARSFRYSDVACADEATREMVRKGLTPQPQHPPTPISLSTEQLQLNANANASANAPVVTAPVTTQEGYPWQTVGKGMKRPLRRFAD